MYCVSKQKFPINAILKNGEKKVLKNYYETYLTSFQIINDYRIDGTVMLNIFSYFSIWFSKRKKVSSTNLSALIF